MPNKGPVNLMPAQNAQRVFGLGSCQVCVTEVLRVKFRACWKVSVLVMMGMAALSTVPVYAANPNSTVGGGGGSGTTWTTSINGPNTYMQPFYEYECDGTGCYVVAATTPEVGSYWHETWSGDPSGSAEATDVCMWGIYDNPSPALPLSMNDINTEIGGTGTTAWSGRPAYSPSCNVLLAGGVQWYAGDNYPLVWLSYPGSLSDLKVVLYSTDNMVSPQSQSVTWQATE